MGVKKQQYLLPNRFVKKLGCKDCQHYVGRVHTSHFCAYEKCIVFSREQLHDMMSRSSEEEEEESLCMDCPYGNPSKPCVSFCLRRIMNT